MQILGIQILALFFALFMVYVTYLHFKKGRISGGNTFLWITMWVVFTFFTLFPQILEPIIRPLNVIRVLDLLMILAFVVLTYLSFDNYIRNKNLEKKIEHIVRKDALNDLTLNRKASRKVSK